MKKSILKAERKELIKKRLISAREIELHNEHWESKVIFSSEDLIWRCDVLDDTDSLISSLLDLAIICIKLKIKVKDAEQLQAELSLHNDNYTIDLETDKWLSFCISLRETEISDMANEISIKLKAYVEKHFNKDLR